MVKIAGGRLRGRTLQTPRDARVRPTTGRMREMLFSMLGARLPGAWVLDLFAGSGVFGIEAVSRGARGAVLVENDPQVASLIRANLQACRVSELALLVEASVLRPGLDLLLARWLPEHFGHPVAFDLIFMDPPYGQGAVAATLEMLASSTLMAPGCLAVAEHEAGGVAKGVAPAWHPMHNRRQGETQISFWQWSG
ncbi:MAG: 16S rRNA (guanine(966)-N(2))-methyltransferase RsmD [Magnetococcales bacterium]|nr:16S rRNA (guanine(966)-N(2))-methyltransferase RsmD [Magnetococcales bacterium]NGZ07419.1 16S rRNA (guanine(966)-N(2))-methyltransferase RsmD [Magnetococcales bacterium]